MQNIKNLTMTFGRDFTFIGNQFRVEGIRAYSYNRLAFL